MIIVSQAANENTALLMKSTSNYKIWIRSGTGGALSKRVDVSPWRPMKKARRFDLLRGRAARLATSQLGPQAPLLVKRDDHCPQSPLEACIAMRAINSRRYAAGPKRGAKITDPAPNARRGHSKSAPTFTGPSLDYGRGMVFAAAGYAMPDTGRPAAGYSPSAAFQRLHPMTVKPL